MGKIKAFFHKESIRKSFAAYMLACILAALLLSLLLSGFCQTIQETIFDRTMNKYISSGHRTELNFYEVAEGSDQPMTEGSSQPVGEGTGQPMVEMNFFHYNHSIDSLMTPFEDIVYNILGILGIAVYPVCFVLCIGLTSVLFYKRVLQKPLDILDEATDHIADNNLDFKIAYDRHNELGRLCSSFEKMRAALQENNIEMWRRIEERKRLNAAFAHDLRTPLTVLKGQSEMLVKYADRMPAEKVAATAEMMRRHIMRLEAYVSTMNDLQRLEDIEVNRTAVPTDDMVRQMRSTGSAVCQDKNFVFKDLLSGAGEMRLDLSVVMRVYENLLSNAARFAADTVTVLAEVRDDCFRLKVSDDGCGFSDSDLANAVKPFYKSCGETDPGHFGMGLNICKILCEKHGGRLEPGNDGGAFVLAVFRQ